MDRSARWATVEMSWKKSTERMITARSIGRRIHGVFPDGVRGDSDEREWCRVLFGKKQRLQESEEGMAEEVELD